jgi:hypothetical protein
MYRRWLAGAAGLAIAILAAAADAKPEGEFTANASVMTPSGTRSMGMSVFITRPLTVEQAQPLKKVLAEGGQQALLNSIKGGNRGHFRLGAIDYPIDLVIVEPTRDGFHYVVVTGRALRYEEVDQGSAALDHPFTVAIFDVPGFGSGEGRIYTRAAIGIDADGHPMCEQYGGTPGTLREVKRR